MIREWENSIEESLKFIENLVEKIRGFRVYEK